MSEEPPRKRPGRRPLAPGTGATERVPIVLTPTEYAAISAAAQRENCSMSELFRRAMRATGYLPPTP